MTQSANAAILHKVQQEKQLKSVRLTNKALIAELNLYTNQATMHLYSVINP